MEYSKKLERVSVLGAGGKMGSGILLLTAVEMADLSLEKSNSSKFFTLNAIDVSEKSLRGLCKYIRTQVQKIAEKKIVKLRKLYSERLDLVDNSEIISEYINHVIELINFTTNISDSYSSNLIFEAVNENPELKVKLFNQIRENSESKQWFLTNTSSVPIKRIDNDAKLDGNVIGFHFYNPPAIQKLVEIITNDETNSELIEFAHLYAKNLNKTIVESNDIAGFIGNGHFMRDALYGLAMLEDQKSNFSSTEALYGVNFITNNLLVRPMGIFQLIDYVGLDVTRYILSVMNPYFEDEVLHSDLLDILCDKGIMGGQNSDGSQKDGFFRYEKGRIKEVLNIDSLEYENLDDNWENKFSNDIETPSWKSLIRNKNRSEILRKYFNLLAKDDNINSKLAIKYFNNSKLIAENLVKSGVAKCAEDVNTVLLTGFFHVYGPINNFIEGE